MKSRRTIVVIDGFYRDSQAVRNYALRERYYLPYQDQEAIDSGRDSPIGGPAISGVLTSVPSNHASGSLMLLRTQWMRASIWTTGVLPFPSTPNRSPSPLCQTAGKVVCGIAVFTSSLTTASNWETEFITMSLTDGFRRS